MTEQNKQDEGLLLADKVIEDTLDKYAKILKTMFNPLVHYVIGSLLEAQLAQDETRFKARLKEKDDQWEAVVNEILEGKHTGSLQLACQVLNIIFYKVPAVDGDNSGEWWEAELRDKNIPIKWNKERGEFSPDEKHRLDRPDREKIARIIDSNLDNLHPTHRREVYDKTDQIIALACQLCNLVKSNFFTADAMRELAQRYIKPRWQQEAGIEPDTIIFDEEEIRKQEREGEMAHTLAQLRYYLSQHPISDLWDTIEGYCQSLEGELRQGLPNDYL